MPAFDDHPVMMILRRYAVTQARLAELSGANRSTIDQIVQGRVKKVNPAVLNALTSISFIPQNIIQRQIDEWFATPVQVPLNRRTEAVLALDPSELSRYYRSFAEWRAEFSPNPNNFASKLRVNRLTIKKYELGSFAGGMPRTLHAALIRTLGLSDDYVVALQRLPGNKC